jgi:hypothetical protein
VQPLWKSLWRFLKNVTTIYFCYTIYYHSWVYIVEGMKITPNRDICTPLFITALFTIPKLWNQPRCPSTDDWVAKCDVNTQWNTIQPQRRIRGWEYSYEIEFLTQNEQCARFDS